LWYLQGITGGAHAVTLQEHKAALAAAAVAAKSYNLGVLTAYISTSKCVFVVAVGKSRRYWKQQPCRKTTLLLLLAANSETSACQQLALCQQGSIL